MPQKLHTAWLVYCRCPSLLLLPPSSSAVTPSHSSWREQGSNQKRTSTGPVCPCQHLPDSIFPTPLLGPSSYSCSQPLLCFVRDSSLAARCFSSSLKKPVAIYPTMTKAALDLTTLPASLLPFTSKTPLCPYALLSPLQLVLRRHE